MFAILRTTLALAAIGVASQAVAQVTFYENENFEGRSFTTQQPVDDFKGIGFNDRASSVVVGSDRWEVCEDARFGGHCVVLRRGNYASLGAMGLNDRVSSVRMVSGNSRPDDNRYAPPAVAPKVTFYEVEGFGGRSLTVDSQLDDFKRSGFNDRASSMVVVGDRWEICENARFAGRCVVLRAGSYPSLVAMGMNQRISSVRTLNPGTRIDDNRYAQPPVAPKVTFYEEEGYGGRFFTVESQLDDLRRSGFNDRASSMVVVGDRWEICDDAQFAGRCVALRAGSYPSMAAMGMNQRVSSVRTLSPDTRIDPDRYAPVPVPAYDARRRGNERLYEANVTSVRAVLGTPEQRCWVEPEQVTQPQSNVNVPATIVGAVIGGILGHQVGGGRGKDLATVGGAVAGGAVGANIGRGNGTPPASAQNVQRCSNTPSQARPDYWDVTYNFRGQEHRVQMTSQPGPTLTVNGEGEPRS